MYRIFCLGFLFFLISATRFNAYSQEIAPQDLEKLQIMEDSMLVTVDSMFNAFIPDSHVGYSERLVRQLIKTLRIPNSYYYPFSKLGEKLNVANAPDSAFRIFNWEVDYSNIYRRYYCAVQLPSEKLKLYGLVDYSDRLGKSAEDTVLTNGKWFGALYYKIMANEVQGRTVYTFFGLNNGSPVSDRKVLDPMYITDSGLVFGMPLFSYPSHQHPRERVKRFILEYKKDVNVSLKWDADRQAIVFDDLQSAVNDPNRRNTYIPSGQYNGFRWGADMWNYVMNLIPITILKDGDAPTDEK